MPLLSATPPVNTTSSFSPTLLAREPTLAAMESWIPLTISSIFDPLASCEITSDSAKTVQVEEILTSFVDNFI